MDKDGREFICSGFPPLTLLNVSSAIFFILNIYIYSILTTSCITKYEHIQSLSVTCKALLCSFYFISAASGAKIPHNITIFDNKGYEGIIYMLGRHHFGIYFTVLRNAFVCRAVFKHESEVCSLILKLTSRKTPSSFTTETFAFTYCAHLDLQIMLIYIYKKCAAQRNSIIDIHESNNICIIFN